MNKSSVAGVARRALGKASPSAKEQRIMDDVASSALDLIRNKARMYPDIVDVELGGSYIKGTWIPGADADIDVFIRFREETESEAFADTALVIGGEALSDYDPYTRFSEHPYVECRVRGIRVNAVPCYAVPRGKWKSAADRSHYHTEFMRERLTSTARKGARLLKLLLKSNRLYGAQIAMQGLSGYAAESLVLHYGGFEETIRALARVEPGQVIGEASKKFETPIVIADPIDPARNLAASASVENIGRLVLLCRSFLRAPAVSYFAPPEPKRNDALIGNCVAVSFSYSERSPDVVWGQLKSAARAVAEQLGRNGFQVVRYDAHTDEGGSAELLFMLGATTIPEYYLREGPWFFSTPEAEQFVGKNAKDSPFLWIGPNARIRVMVRRRHPGVASFLEDLLGRLVDESGVPSGLAPDLRAGFEITVGGRGTSKAVKRQLMELISTDAAVFPPS